MVNLGEYGVPRTCAKRFVWILVIVPSSALNGLVPALLLNLLVGYNTRVLKGRERSGDGRCDDVIFYLFDRHSSCDGESFPDFLWSF